MRLAQATVNLQSVSFAIALFHSLPQYRYIRDNVRPVLQDVKLPYAGRLLDYHTQRNHS